MGRISTDQSHQVMATLATNVDWSTVDFEGLQDLIVRRPKEAGAAFGAWLKNQCRLTVKGTGALIVDRSKPFDPVTFLGRGWSIVEEDQRALSLTEIDLAEVRFESGLQDGERYITGEKKLERLTAMPEIRLDAKLGQTLYEERGQATLRFLHDQFNVSWVRTRRHRSARPGRPPLLPGPQPARRRVVGLGLPLARPRSRPCGCFAAPRTLTLLRLLGLPSVPWLRAARAELFWCNWVAEGRAVVIPLLRGKFRP